MLHLFNPIVDRAKRRILLRHPARHIGRGVLAQISAVLDPMLQHTCSKVSHIVALVETDSHVSVAIQNSTGADGHQQSRYHLFLSPPLRLLIQVVVL